MLKEGGDSDFQTHPPPGSLKRAKLIFRRFFSRPFWGGGKEIPPVAGPILQPVTS